MIRIDLDVDFASPFLGIMSGILSVVDHNLSLESSADHTITILKCKFKKERNNMGFKTKGPDHSIPTKIFDVFREQIYTMIHSYYYGMMLDKKPIDWVMDSADISLNEFFNKHNIEWKGTNNENFDNAENKKL